MTARDILTYSHPEPAPSSFPSDNGKVSEHTPALLLLSQLLDSPTATVEVTGNEGNTVGVVDAMAMLRGLGQMLSAYSGDTSWVEASVASSDYSASAVARAVEDANANLLDMLTSPDPSDNRRILLSLKVSHSDPAGVVRSLQRYGYEVLSSESVASVDYDKACERLSELSLYLNM